MNFFENTETFYIIISGIFKHPFPPPPQTHTPMKLLITFKMAFLQFALRSAFSSGKTRYIWLYKNYTVEE